MWTLTVTLAGALAPWWAGNPAAAADSPWPDLSTPVTASPTNPRDVALIVAIEDYLVAPDIPGATRNARDWYEWLRRVRGAETIKLLTDSDATREEILDNARAIAREAHPDGTLWVIFIGHGAPGLSDGEGLLVGADAQRKASSIDSRSVRRAELIDAVQGLQQRSVIVLDACFSGTTYEGELVPGLQPLRPVSERVSGEATILTAAASDQVAGPLPGDARPAFSYLLLGALWGWADEDGSGTVTESEAMDYASRSLFELVNDREQTPHLQSTRPGAVLSTALPGVEAPDPLQVALAASPPSASSRQYRESSGMRLQPSLAAGAIGTLARPLSAAVDGADVVEPRLQAVIPISAGLSLRSDRSWVRVGGGTGRMVNGAWLYTGADQSIQETAWAFQGQIGGGWTMGKLDIGGQGTVSWPGRVGAAAIAGLHLADGLAWQAELGGAVATGGRAEASLGAHIVWEPLATLGVGSAR